MATLTATPNVVVVNSDPYLPGTPFRRASGPTEIKYEKEPNEVIFENVAGAGWASLPVSNSHSGSWTRNVAVGQLYEVEIRRSSGANSQVVASLRVGAIARRARRQLISDRGLSRGGTWCADSIRTSSLTHILTIGADHTPPVFDRDGLPTFAATAATPIAPLSATRRRTHDVELNTLLPGQPQVYCLVVMNSRGEWDMATELFTTLRRTVTVSFPRITVFNDGDNDIRAFGRLFPVPGQAKFWFRTRYGSNRQPPQTFETHQVGIFDNFGAGQTYPVTVVHTDPARPILRGEEAVYVESWALEDDSPLGPDAASSILDPLRRGQLPLPVGRSEIASGSLSLDCLPSNDGSRLHYRTDVAWSVTYVP